jgi:hypothetical protein
MQIIARDGLPPQDDALVAARDLLAIIRGLVDAAGEREETDTTALARRVTAAVLGYLTMMSAAGWKGNSPAEQTSPVAEKREEAARKATSRRLKRS